MDEGYCAVTREALAIIDATLADTDYPAEVMTQLRDGIDRRLAVMRAGPSIATVLSTVSRATGLCPEGIIGRDRHQEAVFARVMAYLACRESTGHSYAAIGRHIGGRDSSTVRAGCGRAHHLIATDASAEEIWREIVIELSQKAPYLARIRRCDGATGVLCPSVP